MKKLLVCFLLISLFISPAIAEKLPQVYTDGEVVARVTVASTHDANYKTPVNVLAEDLAAKFELEVFNIGIGTIGQDTFPAYIYLRSKKKTTVELIKELSTVSYVDSATTSNILYAESPPVAIMIEEHPADCIALSGETVMFNVRPHGTMPVAYQWQSSKDGGSTWSDIAGANTIYYSFAAQTSDNGAQFRAVINGKNGSVTSNAAKLTLNDPLTVDPIDPVEPTKPEPLDPKPTDPVKPADPVEPTNPEPTQPTDPNTTNPLNPGEQGDTTALNDSGGGCNGIMANGVMLLALSVLWCCGLRNKNSKKSG